MRDLRSALVDLDPVTLRAIAELWRLAPPRGTVREAAEALAQAMLQPTIALSIWADLPAEARQAVIDLAAAGGQMPAGQHGRRYGEVRPMGPARLEREKPWLAPANVAEMLWYRGMLFSAFVEGSAGAQAMMFIPPDLLALLPEASLIAQDDHSRPRHPFGQPASQPSAVYSASSAVVDDLATLLAWCQIRSIRVPPDLSSQGMLWLPDADRRALEPFLLKRGERQRDRLAFLMGLAQHLELVHSPAGRIRPNPPQARPWLQAERPAQLRALLDGWRYAPHWNDLAGVPSIRILNPSVGDAPAWRGDALLIRQAILRHLATVPPDTWWSLPAFLADVKQRDPDFARPDGDYETWYLQDADTGEFLHGFESWDRVEGALIRQVITGPLAWLGQVDLAADAFRLPSATLAWLKSSAPGAQEPGRGERRSNEGTADIQIGLDGTICASQEASRYDRFQIARLSDWAPVDDSHPNSFTYHLTPESLARAAQQGITLQQAIPFLERVSGTALPAALRRALDRWERNQAGARLREGVILQVSNAQLMDEVRPLLQYVSAEILGPSTILLSRRDWPIVARAIREAGVLVSTHEIEQPFTAGSIPEPVSSKG